MQVLRPTAAAGPQLDENYEVELRAGSTYMSKTGAVYTQIRDVTLNEQNSNIIGYNTNQDGSKIDYYIRKQSPSYIWTRKTVLSRSGRV